MSDLTAEQIRQAEHQHWNALGIGPNQPLTGHHLTISNALRAYADALDEGRALPRCENCGGRGYTEDCACDAEVFEAEGTWHHQQIHHPCPKCHETGIAGDWRWYCDFKGRTVERGGDFEYHRNRCLGNHGDSPMINEWKCRWVLIVDPRKVSVVAGEGT